MKNKQLFENYISQHINGIYRFAYTYTKNQEEAEDVVNGRRIVVCFDKYEVAPGSSGSPEFVIPEEIVKDILK